MKASRLFDPRQPGAFRLWLAMLVVVDHLFGIHLGMTAVYLFFILSGFWIHRIWDTRYRTGAYPYIAFVLSRLARLMPIMVCAMGLAVFMQWAAAGVTPLQLLGQFDGAELLSHVLILGYGQTPRPMVLPPAWTLDLEMQFYLLAPALYLLLRAIGPAAFVALGVGAAVIANNVSWALPVAPYLVLFMTGMAASSAEWQPSVRMQKLAALIAVFLVGGLVIWGHAGVLFDPGDAPTTSRLNWLLSIVLAPVALATLWRRDGDTRDAVLGDLSYVVYLLHWPLLIGFAQLGGSLPSAAVMLLFLAALAATSLAVWKFIDRPLNDRRIAIVNGWMRRKAEACHSAVASGQSAYFSPLTSASCLTKRAPSEKSARNRPSL